MGITRSIINWVDKKFDEAVKDEDLHRSARKAFSSGFVEGAVDVVLIVGGVLYLPLVFGKIHFGSKK